MKKNILEIEYEVEGSLIGIVSTAEDFKLAWEFNKLLHTDFVKQKDHQLTFKNNISLVISHFLHYTENTTLRLIKNKSPENSSAYIIPELKNMDYFLLVEDETESWNVDNIKNSLKEIDSIQFTQIVDIEKLKSKENLIFE